jgi:hypothetical protein
MLLRKVQSNRSVGLLIKISRHTGMNNFWKNYNLASQTNSRFKDILTNYQYLNFDPQTTKTFEKCQFWQNIPIILQPYVIFQLKKN